MSTMLSRSGRSNPDGKLIQRFDIPVSEDLNERAIVAASQRGLPKAEFLRGVLDDALTNGCWFELTDESRRALDVLCEVFERTPGEVLVSLVNESLMDRLAMVRMVAQKTVSEQSEQCPIQRGRE